MISTSILAEFFGWCLLESAPNIAAIGKITRIGRKAPRRSFRASASLNEKVLISVI
jgi:hypothetical protein